MRQRILEAVNDRIGIARGNKSSGLIRDDTGHGTLGLSSGRHFFDLARQFCTTLNLLRPGTLMKNTSRRWRQPEDSAIVHHQRGGETALNAEL
jgi:hypothetical protein